MAAKCPETDTYSDTGSDSDSCSDSDTSSDSDDKRSVEAYVKGLSMTPFDLWLFFSLPSDIRSDDGYDWVAVHNGKNFGKTIRDVAGLHENWQKHLLSNKPVTYEVIKVLAVKHHVLSGKWMLFTHGGGKVDHLWSLIASAVIKNDIVCFSAKVSTYKDESNKHVICIYNEDFTNMEEVLEAEKAIRNVGIKGVLLYKPDVYTQLGIYGRTNLWNIKPIIMISHFNLKSSSSEIRTFV